MSTYKKMMNLKIRENELEQITNYLDANTSEWDRAYQDLTEVEHDIAELNYRTDYKYCNTFK